MYLLLNNKLSGKIKMNKPLYKITNEYISCYNELIGNDEFSLECIENTLESIQEEIKDKAISIGAIIKNIECDIDSIQKAEKSMKERREKLTRKSEFLKDYILKNILLCGIDKIFSPEFDIKVKSCPSSVKIEDGSMVPELFMRTKIISEPDKIKLKEALNNGAIIEGITLINNNKLVIS